MNDGFNYSGKVTIKTLHRDKVVKTRLVKNTGCGPLFECVVRALKGNNINDLYPKYIRLYHTDVESSIYPLTESYLENEQTREKTVIPVLVDNSEITSSTNTEASIEYSFLIPASVLSGVTSSEKVNLIAIYNNSNQYIRSNPSAYIRLGESEEIQGTELATGISYLIIWRMTFQNQKAEE